MVNYLLLLGIGVIWGSQFSLNDLAIEGFPPGLVAAGRAVIGFLTLWILVLVMPDRSEPAAAARPVRHTAKLWGLYFLIGIFEATIPLYLIAWGQERVESAIAAILIGTVPIFVVFLAAVLIAGERLRLGNMLGVALGFLGVVVLIGPEALGGLFHDLVGELALLGGALCFAISWTLIKLLPPEIPAIVRARNILLCATLQYVPLTLLLNTTWETHPTWQSALALAALGIFCGGLVYVLFVPLIDRAGPTFASFCNFLVPLFGVLIGMVFLGDRLGWTAIAALALIVLGLAATHLPSRDASKGAARDS